jgi:hypothetical protein
VTRAAVSPGSGRTGLSCPASCCPSLWETRRGLRWRTYGMATKRAASGTRRERLTKSVPRVRSTRRARGVLASPFRKQGTGGALRPVSAFTEGRLPGPLLTRRSAGWEAYLRVPSSRKAVAGSANRALTQVVAFASVWVYNQGYTFREKGTAPYAAEAGRVGREEAEVRTAGCGVRTHLRAPRPGVRQVSDRAAPPTRLHAVVVCIVNRP